MQTCYRPGTLELHEALAARVREWRDTGHAHERYSAIAEIIGFAIYGDGPQAPLRYLRAAQLRALPRQSAVRRRRRAAG